MKSNNIHTQVQQRTKGVLLAYKHANKIRSYSQNKQKNGMILTHEGLGSDGATKLGWSSLGDINDPEAVWPKAINRVAAACKDKTTEETFRQISEELGKMGVSSAF